MRRKDFGSCRAVMFDLGLDGDCGHLVGCVGLWGSELPVNRGWNPRACLLETREELYGKEEVLSFTIHRSKSGMLRR